MGMKMSALVVDLGPIQSMSLFFLYIAENNFSFTVMILRFLPNPSQRSKFKNLKPNIILISVFN